MMQKKYFKKYSEIEFLSEFTIEAKVRSNAGSFFNLEILTFLTSFLKNP